MLSSCVGIHPRARVDIRFVMGLSRAKYETREYDEDKTRQNST